MWKRWMTLEKENTNESFLYFPVNVCCLVCLLPGVAAKLHDVGIQ